MAKLMEPIRIGRCELKNRLVRAATSERMATGQGEVTDDIVALYRNLARGGVGLIITGHAYVDPLGKANKNMLGVHDDLVIKGYKTLARVVHEYDALMLVQINHAGRQTTREVIAAQPVAPSAVGDTATGVIPRALSENEIGKIVSAFIDGARRVQDAGLDGVEVHAAHGYLLSEFLSPRTNIRNDRWGGSLDNRYRICGMIVEGIRRICGEEFLLFVKLNCEDFVEGGLSLDDSIEIAARFEKSGVDLIEISGGTFESEQGAARENIRTPDDEAYFRHHAKKFREKVKLPLALVGGIRSLEVMEQLIQDDGISLISMARPFLRQSDLPKSIARGKGAECLSCNKCLRDRSKPLRCAHVEEKVKLP